MTKQASAVGLPKIPTPIGNSAPVSPPASSRTRGIPVQEFKHSWEIFLYFLGNGIKNIPHLAKNILIPLLAVTVLNIVLESINNYMLFGFPKTILMFFVFITATYNSILPRTLFWIIVFTIGKKLYFRVRSNGFKVVLEELKRFIPTVKEALHNTQDIKIRLLLMATGLGFVTANFLTRNNRLDKVLVTYVLVLAIIDSMSKGQDTMLYHGVRLVYQDVIGMIRKGAALQVDQVTVLLLGYVLGLLANSLFGILKMDTGGYVVGLILFIVGMAMFFVNSKGVNGHQHQDSQG